ncbi:MAG: hypothetical protein WDN25_24745 [Acetobacteraceae bacterium]
MSGNPTPRKLALLIEWFCEPPHFGDRRIQACAVVVFCMAMITLVYLYPSAEPINARIIDWSFASLLGVVGIYHTARGFDELLGRRGGVTTLIQSGAGAETSKTAETAELSQDHRAKGRL